MRLELIPVVLGAVVALMGLALVADAWLPDRAAGVGRERRRRARAERDRRGEAALGVGTLCLAAALIGRDTWRFNTLTIVVGVLLVLAGAVLNRRYLRELFAYRGPARRAVGPPPPPVGGAPQRPEMRGR